MHGISGKNFHRLRGPNRSSTRGRSSSTRRDREKKGRGKKKKIKRAKNPNNGRRPSAHPTVEQSRPPRRRSALLRFRRANPMEARHPREPGSNKTVPRGGGFLCAILKFHASGKYAEGVSLEFNHYAASRSVHAALLPALRAASHCWSASDGEFLGAWSCWDIPGSGQASTTLVRPAFIRGRYVFGSRRCWGSETGNLVSFLVVSSPLPFLFPLIPDYSHFPSQ